MFYAYIYLNIYVLYYIYLILYIVYTIYTIYLILYSVKFTRTTKYMCTYKYIGDE